jgi:2-keto-myo-inositol isomerase
MKIAFHQITSGSGRDLEETFAAYARHGWNHFEVNLSETDKYAADRGYAEVAKLAKGAGLTCVGATGLSISAFQGQDALGATLEQMRKSADAMNRLGCEAIVCGGETPENSDEFPPRSAGSSEAALSKRDTTYRDALARFAEAVNKVADVADEYGVKLALEVNWCGLARSIRSMAELLSMVGRDNVGAVWDPAHFFSTPSRLADLELLDGKIIHAHLNDFRDCATEVLDINGDRVTPGEGILPMVEWSDKVAQCGYDGWHCLELFSDDVWAKSLDDLLRDAKAGCERVWPDAQF